MITVFKVSALLALAQAQVIILTQNNDNITQIISSALSSNKTLASRNICMQAFDHSTNAGIKISHHEFTDAIKALNGEASKMQYLGFSAALQRSKIDSKREAAMFLANAWTITDGLVNKREQFCVADRYKNIEACLKAYNGDYIGRGYFWVRHDYNYKEISNAIYNSDKLVKTPELMAEDECVAWWSAAIFWDKNVHDADGVKDGKFGTTALKLNEKQCTESSDLAKKLVKTAMESYKSILKAWNIREEANPEGCDTMVKEFSKK